MATELSFTDRAIALLEEKKRLLRVRASLDSWAGACNLSPALHHRLINRELEGVETGPVKKLMIFLPPGSAKSTYSSVQFPPWFLARQPSRAILACSHSADLAASFGRRGRELVNLHAKELGYRLSKESQAADYWKTTNGGEYRAAGVGAGIAGFRADLGLIDDPIGKKEDADSLVMRNKVWAWYEYDFIPRLKPNASIVLIQTRWHEDDLAGRLLAREGSEWRVVSLPLLAIENDPLGRNPGDLLWPEWFTPAMVADASKDPRKLNCLYQQNPIPESGNYFDKDWIQTYAPSQLPKELRYYAASDHAVSQKQEADSTVLMPAGVDALDNIYILPDLEWDKFLTDVAVEKMIDLNAKYKFQMWWAGREHITQSIGPFLNKRMQERNSYIPIDEQPSTRDLSTRAQPIKGRMSSRKVFFPSYTAWWPRALHELLSFPLGNHDDFIAALSELGRGLDSMVSASPPPAEEKYETVWRPTMRWIKDQEKRKERERATLLADR